MAGEGIEALQRQYEAVAHRVGVLEDVHAIRCLHHAYGFFIDKCLYDETVDLFAEDSEVRFMDGIFRG